MSLTKLPELSDDDIHECWQCAQVAALNQTETARRGRTLEEVTEHFYQGFACERAFFRWLDDGSIDECIAGQRRGYSKYGSDGKNIDVKSADTSKWGLDFDYRLTVWPRTLKNDRETTTYVLIVHDVSGNYYAGSASRERMMTAPLWEGKHALRISELDA